MLWINIFLMRKQEYPTLWSETTTYREVTCRMMNRSSAQSASGGKNICDTSSNTTVRSMLSC